MGQTLQLLIFEILEFSKPGQSSSNQASQEGLEQELVIIIVLGNSYSIYLLMCIQTSLSIILLEVGTFELGWEFQSQVDTESFVDTSERICSFHLFELLFKLIHFILYFFIDSD